MATVLEVYTTEEQRSVMRFYGQKNSMQRIFIKKCFLFAVGSVYRVKRFGLGGRSFVEAEGVETEMRKLLRQQPKRFSAGGFDALIN
jgi:hypothetical protein